MKRFELKTVVVGFGEGARDETYIDLAKTCVRFPGKSEQQGLDFDAMMKRFKVLEILDELEEGASSVDLEDDYAKALEDAVRGFRWTQCDGGIVQFLKDMTAPKDVTKKSRAKAA